jgi:hypothetical protein
MSEYSFLAKANDRLAEFAAAGPDGLGGDDAAEPDDRHLGGPAAHAHHHVPCGLGHRQPGAAIGPR